MCISRWLERVGSVGTMQQRVRRRDSNPDSDLSVTPRGVLPVRGSGGGGPTLQLTSLHRWAPNSVYIYIYTVYICVYIYICVVCVCVCVFICVYYHVCQWVPFLRFWWLNLSMRFVCKACGFTATSNLSVLTSVSSVGLPIIYKSVFWLKECMLERGLWSMTKKKKKKNDMVNRFRDHAWQCVKLITLTNGPRDTILTSKHYYVEAICQEAFSAFMELCYCIKLSLFVQN